MNKSVLLCFKQGIPANWAGVKVKLYLDSNIFAKTWAGYGARVKFFGVGMESKLNSDPDQLCSAVSCNLSVNSFYSGSKLRSDWSLEFYDLVSLNFLTRLNFLIPTPLILRKVWLQLRFLLLF